MMDEWKMHIQAVKTALIAAGRRRSRLLLQYLDLTSLAPPDIPGVVRLFLHLSVTFHFAYSGSFNPK